MQEKLEDWASGWLTTKICEDAVKDNRLVQQQDFKGSLNRLGRFSALVASKTLSKYGRDVMEPTPEDKAAATKELEASDCSSHSLPLSVPSALLEAIVEEHNTHTYPSQSAESYHDAGLIWTAYTMAEDWADFESAWPSLLCVPGNLLFRTQACVSQCCGLILRATEYYALIWSTKFYSNFRI